MTKTYLQSVGMSCQTRHQIERFAGTEAARAAGIELRSGPFDWLGAPPLRVAGYIDAGLPAHGPGDVIERDDRAFLPEPGFHAVHAYRVKEPDGRRRLDIEATFERERDKFFHLREKFLSTEPERTCFVLANCQNNLVGDLYHVDEGHEYRIDSSKLDRLQASLERLFGTSCQLLAISRTDRFDGDPGRDPRVRLLSSDATEWKGDDAQWTDVLADHLGVQAKQPAGAAAPA